MVNFKYRAFLDTNVLLDVLCTPDRPSDLEAFGQSILSLSNYINIESIHIFDIKDAILSRGRDLEDEAFFAHACEKDCEANITSDRHFQEQKSRKGPLMFTPDTFVARAARALNIPAVSATRRSRLRSSRPALSGWTGFLRGTGCHCSYKASRRG